MIKYWTSIKAVNNLAINQQSFKRFKKSLNNKPKKFFQNRSSKILSLDWMIKISKLKIEQILLNLIFSNKQQIRNLMGLKFEKLIFN
jgi:hypothetical protein